MPGRDNDEPSNWSSAKLLVTAFVSSESRVETCLDGKVLTELIHATAFGLNFALALSASQSERRDCKAYHDFDGELAKD